MPSPVFVDAPKLLTLRWARVPVNHNELAAYPLSREGIHERRYQLHIPGRVLRASLALRFLASRLRRTIFPLCFQPLVWHKVTDGLPRAAQAANPRSHISATRGVAAPQWLGAICAFGQRSETVVEEVDRTTPYNGDPGGVLSSAIYFLMRGRRGRPDLARGDELAVRSGKSAGGARRRPWIIQSASPGESWCRRRSIAGFGVFPLCGPSYRSALLK